VSLGPGGKYDSECDELRKRLEAECVMLIVGGGSRGSSFSMAIDASKRDLLGTLRATVVGLVSVAQQLRADIERLERELPS
jgi:hypothetical protein